MLLNRKGFTLVEVMVSLVVLLLVFLGLMQGALLAIDSNARDMFREDALSVADAQMQAARDIPFATLAASGTFTTPITRTYRNNMSITYTATRTVVPMDANNLQVSVAVTWPWRGQTYNFATSTIITQYS